MKKFDLENFPTSESAKKMLEFVSDGFYDKSYVGKWLFQVMGAEYDKALEKVMELPDQFFPETATWGLMYHEIKWGLPVRENLSYKERRKLIYQKRDSKAPMTPYRMETYLSNLTGYEVHVSDVHDTGEYGYIPEHPNIFQVTFLGEGTLDAKRAIAAIQKIKQTHTAFFANELIKNSFRVSVLFQNRITCIGSFYPRPMLLLNGEARLDGSCLLDGFFDDSPYADLYPVQLAVYGDIRQETVQSARYRQHTELRAVIYKDMHIGLRGAAKNHAASKSTICALGSVKETVSCGEKLVVEKDLWYLDGSLQMDGSVCMDADIYEEQL